METNANFNQVIISSSKLSGFYYLFLQESTIICKNITLFIQNFSSDVRQRESSVRKQNRAWCNFEVRSQN